MTIIAIRKRRSSDGFVYEIADFPAYLAALQARGIETPVAKYRITIPYDIEQAIRDQVDVNEQVALFFRISPTAGLGYEVLDQTQVA